MKLIRSVPIADLMRHSVASGLFLTCAERCTMRFTKFNSKGRVAMRPRFESLDRRVVLEGDGWEVGWQTHAESHAAAESGPLLSVADIAPANSTPDSTSVQAHHPASLHAHGTAAATSAESSRESDSAEGEVTDTGLTEVARSTSSQSSDGKQESDPGRNYAILFPLAAAGGAVSDHVHHLLSAVAQGTVSAIPRFGSPQAVEGTVSLPALRGFASTGVHSSHGVAAEASVERVASRPGTEEKMTGHHGLKSEGKSGLPTGTAKRLGENELAGKWCVTTSTLILVVPGENIEGRATCKCNQGNANVAKLFAELGEGPEGLVLESWYPMVADPMAENVAGENCRQPLVWDEGWKVCSAMSLTEVKARFQKFQRERDRSRAAAEVTPVASEQPPANDCSWLDTWDWNRCSTGLMVSGAVLATAAVIPWERWLQTEEEGFSGNLPYALPCR